MNILRNIFVGRSALSYCRLKACRDGWRSIRSISTGGRLRVKLFVDNESTYYQRVMESRAGYVLGEEGDAVGRKLSRAEFDSLVDQEWEGREPAYVGEAFAAISEYARANGTDIADPRYDRLIDRLTDCLAAMTDRQLGDVCRDLRRWPETESVFARNFIEVWTALDDALEARLPKWEPETALRFADLMHRLNLTRKSDFSFKAIRKIITRKAAMTPRTFVQTMFYIGATRRQPLGIIDMQQMFARFADDLTIDEVGVCCSGFFRTKSSLKERALVERLIERVASEANAVHEMTLSAIVKLIRLSQRPSDAEPLSRMLDSLLPRIPGLSFMCCTQLAIAPTPISFYHKPSLRAICERFLSNPSETRLKDIERLAFACSHFNHNSNEHFYDRIVDELRRPDRRKEFDDHGRCLVACLSYLAIAGRYPLDLIDHVLNEKFVKAAYGFLPSFKYDKSKAALELLVLNCSTEIERPNYRGSSIDKKYIISLAKSTTSYLPNDSGKYPLNLTERTMLDIILTVREMQGGKKFIHGDHVLPHFDRGVIIICNDAKGNPVKIDGLFPSSDFGLIRKPPIPNHTWYAILFFGRHSYTSNTKEFVGLANMKIRQLKRIGYHPVPVSLSDWPRLRNDKVKFIRDCMQKCREELPSQTEDLSR